MLHGLDLKALLSSGLSAGDGDDEPPSIPGYEVIERIGRGGMGSVYLAEQKSLSRLVAVKVIAMESSASSGQRELLLSRLESEALIMAKLNHPNLVAVFDFIKLSNGDAAIVMERISGGNVRDYLKQPEPVPIETTISIGEQVASCLVAAHAAGVIHRDIKPENLLVAKDGTVKVSDFGLALDAETLRLTASGTSVGTVGYSAPEQLEGAETDERSDVYSLGVVLYELLTALKPMGDVKRPGALRREVPTWLERVILDALQTDRERRILSAEILYRRLDSRSTGSPRRTWIAAAAALIIGLIGTGGIWYRQRPSVTTAAPVPTPIRLNQIRGIWEKVDAGYRCGRGIRLLGVTTAPTVIGKTIRVEFTRHEGVTPIAIFFQHPNGYGTALLDAYRRALSGIEVIDGETLMTSLNTFDFEIENERRYLWELSIEENKIITHVDGVLMQKLTLTSETLGIAEDWEWDATEIGSHSIVIGSFNNLATIHEVSVE